MRSLILSERIETTEAKAKAIRPTIDKLINHAKKDSTNLVNEFVTDKAAFEKLVKELTPRMKSRNSGYTSMVKLGKRKGDDAKIVSMALILDEVKSSAVSPQSPEKKEKAKIKKETK